MQKNPTANEQHLQSFVCDNQQHAASLQHQPTHPSHTAAVNTAALTVTPALPALVVGDSPHSPLSSELSVASQSQSQPSSPSSLAASHDFVSSAVAPSDSSCAVSALPVTAAAAAPRVRVPLSQVVSSLTQRWSMEYLAEADAGDVDAQCLVAQMYLTGWGALKEDQAEGKRWLQRAKEGGIAGTVNKLELLYLGDADSSGGTGGSRRVSDENCGYYSGYANTPQASPCATSLVASFMPPTPTHSFFASVAATISPKPVVIAPLLRSTSPSAAAGGGRLSVPNLHNDRVAAVGVGSGSSGASSGDEHSHVHHSPHHGYHWHMQHVRGHSGELGVSAS